MGMYELLQYSPLAHAIGMTLLHFLWQGAAIALVLGCALAIVRRGSPQVRYLLSCLALLLMFLLPVFTFVYLYATSDVKGPPVVSSRVYALIEEAKARAEAEAAARTAAVMYAVVPEHGGEAVALGTASGAANATDEGAGNTAAATTASDTDGDSAAYAKGISLEIPWDKVYAFCYAWSPWCSVFWGFGVALLTMRLIGALYFTARLRKRHATRLNGHWQETVDRLRERLGITRAVTLLQSGRVLVPTMVGWLRPVVLLPASALTGLTPGQLEALLAHELAHIRRHDYLVNLLQNVVETLLFYHPAVWWVSKRIRDERELCCDDIVLKVCGNARVYATALADMLTLRMGESAVALAASGGSLPNRLRRMLGIAPPAASRMARGVAGTIVVALLLTVSTFFALRAAAADAIPPEAMERFYEAVEMKEEARAAIAVERIKLLEEAIRVIDALIQVYPDVDEFRGELGVLLYELSWGRGLVSDEEKIEIITHAIEVIEPVADEYKTSSIAREYRFYLGRCYDRMVVWGGEGIETERQAIELTRELVEVEPDNPVYHRYLASRLNRLGTMLIEAKEPHADVIREAWEEYLRGELLGASYESRYYELQTCREEIRDGRHWIDGIANQLQGLGRTDETIETFEMALAGFAEVVEEDPQFYGDLITIRRQYEGFLKGIGRTTEADQVAAETDALREWISGQYPGFFSSFRNMQTRQFHYFSGATVDYPVRIAAPGDYQLYLRLEAHDGKSCVVLAYVDELADGEGGSIADTYLITCLPDMDHDFATESWNATGQFENAGSNVSVVWSIPAAGDYTLRVVGRDDGVALDALVFQQKDLPAPDGEGLVESQRTANGVFMESGRLVTIEAEHFADRRTHFTDRVDIEWLAVPEEAIGDVPHANARGDAYIQVLPDRTLSPQSLLQFAETDRGNAQVWITLGDTYSGKILFTTHPYSVNHQDYEKAVEAYSKAVELNSMAEDAWYSLGSVRAEMGQYTQAAQDFAKVAELAPDNAYDWYITALAQLASDDTQAYRATCADVLERFSGADDAEEALWAAWTCLLVPGSVREVAVPLNLAEMGAQRDPSNAKCAQACAVALYRAGRLDEALSLLQAVADSPPSNMSPAYSQFFLAMTHYRLGDVDDARSWLQKATEQAEKETQSGASWNRRVTLELLQREAEEVLNGKEVAKTGS